MSETALIPFEVTVIGPHSRKTWFCFAANWHQAQTNALHNAGMAQLIIVKRCKG